MYNPVDKQEFARLRLEAIAAALLVSDGSAKQRPPVGVGGKAPHPSASKDAATFPRGEGKETSPKSLPLWGRWPSAARSDEVPRALDPRLHYYRGREAASRGTSSVTALCAAPPSPEGKAWGTTRFDIIRYAFKRRL